MATDLDDMPDLEPMPATAAPSQQQRPAAAASLPFPTLITSAAASSTSATASGPGAWMQHSHANQPISVAPVHSSPISPRVVTTASHVAVPPSLAFPDLTAATTNTHAHSSSGGGGGGGHGHSHGHDGVPCSHSHGPAIASPPISASPAASSSPGHGHSHGGAPCTGHDNDHGHAHDHHGHSHDAPSRPKTTSWSDENPSRNTSKGSSSYLTQASTYTRLAWRSAGNSRAVLAYIMMKAGFMALQFIYGLYTQNLGLVSSSFHTGFDVIAMACSLIAMLNAKYPARHPYSYGNDRQEIVAAFTNAIFLFFVATFMIIETFHTAYSPPEVAYDDIVLAGLGFVMDLTGLMLFHTYLTLKPQTEVPEQASNWSITTLNTAGRGHIENMHGVALHVVSDIVGHASLLAAVWIYHFYPSASYVFALSFLFSAILIIQLVLPLFQVTGSILLMTTPVSVRLGLDRCIREISFYDGVLELRSAHWFTQAPGVIVGSLHIRIRSDAEEQQILTYVNSVLKKYVTILTVQVEKDVPLNVGQNWLVQNARSP